MSDINMSLSSSGAIELGADKMSVQPVNKQMTAEIKLESEDSPKKLQAEDIEATVKEVNAFVQNMHHNLSFKVDEELGEPIISVTDLETNEVIRQIPSEELVVLRKKMDDVTGILFDTKV